MAEQFFPWPSKISGYGDAPVDQILGNEKNWRIHPKHQQDALAGVLSEVGLVQNIVINRRTSDRWPTGERGVETLIDGHARVMLALRHGQSTLPCTYVDLTPEEESIILATLDPLGSMAGTDATLLAPLLASIESRESAVTALLTQMANRLTIPHTAPGFTATHVNPTLSTDCCVEIHCATHDLAEFLPIFKLWETRPSVTIHIQR